MNIEFTVQEYFEELKLMEEQYGQEEELYPWIYMLLKMAESRKHILNDKYEGVSIRDVHNWKSKNVDGMTSKKKNILEEISSKKGGPPDIAIFHKKSNNFLGSVEVKNFYEPRWVTVPEGKYSVNKGIKFDGYEIKYSFAPIEEDREEYKRIKTELIENNLRAFELVPVQKIGSHVYRKTLKLEVTVISPNKKNVDDYSKKFGKIGGTELKKTEVSCFEEKQIIKQIERFKKVLYTNGLEFYLLRIDSKNSDSNADDGSVVEVKKIADLKKVYEKYRKDKFSTDLQATEEWERLITGLTAINWHDGFKTEILPSTNDISGKQGK